MKPFGFGTRSRIIAALALLAILPGCITPKPRLVPMTGIYPCPVMVTITDPRPNAAIFYTTDGSVPTSTSSKYTGAFPINSTDTVRAIAIAPGARASRAASVAYSCALSREDFATMLQKQYGLPAASKPVNFPDVPRGSPSYFAIQSAAPFMNAQVLCATCYIGLEFYPKESISREISTLALVRVLIANGKIQLVSAAEAARIFANVKDAAALPAVSRPYYATAIKIGVMPVQGGNTIQPEQLQTSQDVIAIFNGIQKQFNLPPAGAAGVPQ